MKKSLIALAALATVATAAQAQSSVTVYGVLDAGIQMKGSANTTGDGSSAMANGILATPRLGFRGAEDLGGGKKAVFQLESGINNATGGQGSSTNFFDRFAYVGLANSIGQVDLGRNTHAGWNAAAAGITDVLALQGEGIALTGGGVVGTSTTAGNGLAGVPNWRANQVISIVGNTGLGTTRSDNMIKFTSSTFNGLTVRLGASMGGQAGWDEKRSSRSAGVVYAQGAFQAAASYFENKDDSNKFLKYESYGATYTVGAVKFGAGYHQLKSEAGYTRSTTTNALTLGTIYDQPNKSSSVDSKTSVWNLGAVYTVSPTFNTGISYYEGKFEGGNLSAANDGAKLKSVLWINKYSLSKRTTIYGAVDYAKADTGVRQSAAADSNTGVSVGVNHTF